VLQGNQEYSHVVALQTYVLHTLGVRMVLQSLVVDLSTSRNEKANGCFEMIMGCSKRVS
jgi:hypothetical protein